MHFSTTFFSINPSSVLYRKSRPQPPVLGIHTNSGYISALWTLPSAAAWRGVLGPAAPIACPERSLRAVCGFRAPLPLRRGRRSRSCAAPKIADQHHVYTTFHNCEFFSDDRLYRDSLSIAIGYNSTVIGRSLGPRRVDSHAPCAVAEGLRGRRRPRGCALDRRSASLTRRTPR